LFICPINPQQQWRPLGLPLSTLWAGYIDRQRDRHTADTGAQQQMQVASWTQLINFVLNDNDTSCERSFHFLIMNESAL